MRIVFLFFVITLFGYAQKDTIQLKEIVIDGFFSKKYNSGFSVVKIKDSVFKTSNNLTEVLQEQSNVYFKEYGKGMLSSISLKGTGAAHTAVYFNGIAINSVLNGQTDFNTISVKGFDQIIIKEGGGSTILGSGAVGGAINLKDEIYFIKTLKTEISGGIGSYNSQFGSIQYNNSNTKFFQKYVLDFDKSDNNYAYLKTNKKNENGEYLNFYLKSVIGYQFNRSKQLHFFSTYSTADRNLSGTLTAASNSKLKDENLRLLLRYLTNNVVVKHKINLAYLGENYRFYLYKESPNYSHGKANSVILKYNLSYFLNNNIQFFTGLETKYITANGSDLDKHQNIQSEGFVLTHFKLNNKIQFNLSLRKGIASNFNIPFVYSVDAKYDVNNNLSLKANASTNYRLPTINDLYWNPGGNSDLKPENSNTYQTIVDYKKNAFSANVSFFMIDSKNLIQWQPVTNVFWQPINIQKVNSKGVSVRAEYNFKKIRFNFGYDYTDSKNKKLEKQLIYVPLHKVSFNTSYSLKNWSFFINNQYNGKVYTTTSNSEIVSDYFLTNFRLNKKISSLGVNIGLKAQNIFNSVYQVIAYRPMPNRNYQLYFNIKF
jgi:iron complex outermembrane receptor protein